MQNESTIHFTLWNQLLMLEGSSLALAMLIEMVYNDPAIPNDDWNLSRPGSRRVFAQSIKHDGQSERRLGAGARSAAVAIQIQRKAISCGVKTFVMSSPTDSIETKKTA